VLRSSTSFFYINVLKRRRRRRQRGGRKMGKKSTHGTILNTKSNHRDFYKINNLKIKKGQED
jgi:hypothetical protein